MARDLRDVPLLAHTHGQPATPTTMGKELAVLAAPAAAASCAGSAPRSTSASSTAPPAPTARTSPRCPTPTGRPSAARSSRASGLHVEPAHHPDREPRLAGRALQPTSRGSTGCCTTSAPTSGPTSRMGYFAQVRGQGTVGSSTMPHKVNPIRFENAEANLEVSNALLDVLGSTLVQSRLQRDLTDSSMQRNIGTAFGHSLLAHRQRRARPGRARRRARGHGRRPRRQLGGARRAGPVGDAGPRGAGRRRAWRAPTSGSRS